MNETITIDKETAQQIADFILAQGFEWRHWYNKQRGINRILTPESRWAWIALIDTLGGPTPEIEQTDESSHSRQQPGPAQTELPE